VIDEALKAGSEPRKLPKGWMTGQTLPEKSAASSPDDAGWGILKVDRPIRGRQVVHVRLHRKVSLDVLRLITIDIMRQAEPLYRYPTYISFYTPWSLGELGRDGKREFIADKTRFWAGSTLDFRPQPLLIVDVKGVTVEEEAVLRSVPMPRATKVIGSCIDEERGGRLTIYRAAGDRLYLEELFSSGKSVGEDHELIELPSSEGRRFEDKSPDSDRDISYFVIDESGDLQTRFKDGMVWKAQAIE
jgi:hypothetical protein